MDYHWRRAPEVSVVPQSRSTAVPYRGPQCSGDLWTITGGEHQRSLQYHRAGVQLSLTVALSVAVICGLSLAESTRGLCSTTEPEYSCPLTVALSVAVICGLSLAESTRGLCSTTEPEYSWEVVSDGTTASRLQAPSVCRGEGEGRVEKFKLFIHNTKKKDFQCNLQMSVSIGCRDKGALAGKKY